ncbi:38963_t:CDS:2 [Gigaspora margarita]|uniref:38963_t:CDS:1 n=1 Tax=Gigaspora margarita TaxID=4874 RepID=A0ABN7W2K9_GIGMA|nr:38963_t:CDS:2 [Gigaspora margarita]
MRKAHKKDLVQIANEIKKKNDLVQTAIQYKNEKEIMEETMNTMNAHLNTANNEKILNYKTEFDYKTQISAQKEELDKLKDYEGLEKGLESLIEKNDRILTEWFEYKKKKNTIENNRIMIEAFFKNKQQNELENFIHDSKKEIEKLEENVTSIRLKLKNTIEKTEIKRYNKKSIYNSQILELDKQIDYLYDDNYTKLKSIEMVYKKR